MGSTKLRGHLKRALMIDLASGELSLERLGAKYGVTAPAVLHFRDRNLEEIAEIKKAIDDGVRAEIAGLWIADKTARIASYQSDVDLLTDQLEDGTLEPADFRGALKVKAQVLKQVAEELGDLRVSVDLGGEVRYSVNGVNPEELK